MSNSTNKIAGRSFIKLIHSETDFDLVSHILRNQKLVAVDPYKPERAPLPINHLFLPDEGVNVIITKPDWIFGPFSVYEESGTNGDVKFIQQQTNFFGFGLYMQKLSGPNKIGTGQIVSWSKWTTSPDRNSFQVPRFVKSEMRNFFNAIKGEGYLLAGGEIYNLTKGASVHFIKESTFPYLPFEYSGEVKFIS